MHLMIIVNAGKYGAAFKGKSLSVLTPILA